VAVSQFLNGGEGLLGDNCELTSPEIVLNRLNRAFAFERFDSFFSIIGMSIDVQEGWLTYSCAGHPPPILLGPNGGLKVLDRRGPIIGINGGKPFGEETIKLHPGDKIVLYTDGLLENRNPKGEFFGKMKFYDSLQKNQHEPIQRMVDAVYATARGFRQTTKPDDDISILGVEYTGKTANHFSI
jgi:sigma-B regulation protein RsbU (phosphoserine phosphatase)